MKRDIDIGTTGTAIPDERRAFVDADCRITVFKTSRRSDGACKNRKGVTSISQQQGKSGAKSPGLFKSSEN